MIKVPPDHLSAEALRGLVDAFVLREGTDYGHRDYSLQEKRAAVLRQLETGEVEIWFDPATESTDLRIREASDKGSGRK